MTFMVFSFKNKEGGESNLKCHVLPVKHVTHTRYKQLPNGLLIYG